MHRSLCVILAAWEQLGKKASHRRCLLAAATSSTITDSSKGGWDG
jgi:hypothetical protein